MAKTALIRSTSFGRDLHVVRVGVRLVWRRSKVRFCWIAAVKVVEMPRPEVQAPPEIFYNETEARKYTTSSRIIEIQVCPSAFHILSLASLFGEKIVFLRC